MTEYLCPHWGDPFSVIVFPTLGDAEQYARVYERVTGEEIEIEEREGDNTKVI